jgi:DNA polymerase-4
MDCFYAAVEMRDNPQLKGVPLVIGGKPDSRGVVCTANYEARKFGIHSAMACSKAYRLCKEAVFIHPNFSKYKSASNTMKEIFLNYTEMIQPLSLDEAFLDVTHNTITQSATDIAIKIKSDILEKISITGSAGVAPNKLLAKIASDMNKPDGLTVVKPAAVENFLKNLPLRKISGVGPVFEKRLKSFGFNVCSDLWTCSQSDLISKFGDNSGQFLYLKSRGIDTSPVKSHRVRKSIGHEETYSTDITDKAIIRQNLHEIAEKVVTLIQSKKIAGYTLTVKIKFSDFRQLTRSQTYSSPIADLLSISNTAVNLLEKCIEENKKPVRLLGITLSNLSVERWQPLLIDN